MSPHEARFALLGPLVVAVGGEPVALPGPRQRAALALMLLQPGRTVPVPRLIDALWGEEPPRTARAQVHNVVSKLRQALPCGVAERMVRHGDGYQLRVDPALVDAECFAADLAAARVAHRSGEPAGAARLLRAGLGRWRGEPLDGIDLPFAVAARTRLAEERRSGWELLADVQLGRGLEAELIPELTGLLAENPHWEGLADRLARCLFRAGRQPDALAVVRTTRERLAEDFGLDAGADLTELEQALLRGDAALLGPTAVAEPGAPPAGPDRTRPALLPAPGFGFVGRAAESAELDRLLRTSSGEARIAVVTGPAGMGKTSLAVRWGHAAVPAFPDGQLFVDLHGYDEHERVAPGRALERFLLALGVPGDRIPADQAQREDLYRSTVAPLRLLVVLDNAADEEQVRPLLPGGVGAATVITSRSGLGGLAADHGARVVELGVLPESDAVAALERIAGADVVAGAPEAAAALVRFCAGLPLALRISAVRLIQPPRVAVTELAAELEPAQDRLAGLRLPGSNHAVSRSLDHSYRALGPVEARCFRALCLFPGASVSRAALAAMAAEEADATAAPASARAAAAALLGAHLADSTEEGRYTVHDLVRLYGREQAARLPQEARQARDGAVGWYAAVAQAGSVLISPFTLPYELRLRRPWAGPVPFTDRDRALAWFTAEADNAQALIRQAEAEADPESVWPLALGMAPYLLQRHRLGQLVETAEAGERAARTLGLVDRAGTLANYSGIAYAMLKDERAAPAFDRALAAALACGDAVRAMRIGGNLGNFYYERGLFEQAAERQQEAVALARELGDDVNVTAGLLANLALTRIELGEQNAALDLTEEAAALADPSGEAAQAQVYRGQHAFALLRAGRAAEALELSRRCLAEAERFDAPLQRARMTDQVGQALQALGRLGEARGALLEAARLHEEIGSDQAARVRARLAELEAPPR